MILLDDSELHLIGQRMNLSVGRDGKNGLTTHRLDRMSSADNNQTGSGCFHDAGALGNGCDRLNRDVPRSRMGCHPAGALTSGPTNAIEMSFSYGGFSALRPVAEKALGSPIRT